MNRNIEYAKKYIMRNKKILNCPLRFTRKNHVNLHWWSTRRDDHVENIGDYLSVIVCKYMMQKKRLSFDDKVSKTKHLYAIGSIIQGGAQNATIWGSGLKSGQTDIPFLARKTRKLDVRCVRGPKTREVLVQNGYNCPENYGDPALLLPLLYNNPIKQDKDYLVILHHNTVREIKNSITPLMDNYKDFIDAIRSSKYVISSSLHGVIIAEAYGIPAVLLQDKSTDDRFKYDDYYLSTGRKKYPIASTVEEALKIKPTLPKNITKLQKMLLASFPYDLWEK